MNIKLELLRGEIHDIIDSRLEELNIDINKIAQTTAIKALSEIQEIISNQELSDFYALEEIVCVFEKYHLSFGGRHDF